MSELKGVDVLNENGRLKCSAGHTKTKAVRRDDKTTAQAVVTREECRRTGWLSIIGEFSFDNRNRNRPTTLFSFCTKKYSSHGDRRENSFSQGFRTPLPKAS
jgi:hypothetical protein